MKLQQVKTFLWQWGWLILLGTAVAALTAYLTSHSITPVYESSATWLIDEPAKAETAATAGQSLGQTYALVALSRPVLAETIDLLALPFGEEQLQGMVTAVSPDNTNLVTIQVKDSDPGRAAMIANTIGQVLAEQNAARDSQRFAEPLANWQQQIEDSQAKIAALESQLAPAEVTNRDQLESNLADAQARYDNAVAQMNNLLAQQAAESTIITSIEAAQAAAAPVHPRTTALTIWAAVAGALAALVVAGLAQRSGNQNQELAGTAVVTLPATSND